MIHHNYINLTHFLEWPEGATNEWCDAQGLPTPAATWPMVRLKMAVPKRGEWPSMLHNCWGNHTQVWCCPIHCAYNYGGLTHTLHISNAGPRQMAQGVGQGICQRDRDSTHLVAWVSQSELGVLERCCQNECTTESQETGCRFLTSHTSIWESGLVGSSSQPLWTTRQKVSATWKPQELLRSSEKYARRKPWP